MSWTLHRSLADRKVRADALSQSLLYPRKDEPEKRQLSRRCRGLLKSDVSFQTQRKTPQPETTRGKKSFRGTGGNGSAGGKGKIY